MNDHPEFVAMKARHKAEIDELTQAFARRNGELASLLPGLRDPKTIIELRKSHRIAIKEAVNRHVKLENEWRVPAPKADVAHNEPEAPAAD